MKLIFILVAFFNWHSGFGGEAVSAIKIGEYQDYAQCDHQADILGADLGKHFGTNNPGWDIRCIPANK